MLEHTEHRAVFEKFAHTQQEFFYVLPTFSIFVGPIIEDRVL